MISGARRGTVRILMLQTKAEIKDHEAIVRQIDQEDQDQNGIDHIMFLLTDGNTPTQISISNY